MDVESCRAAGVVPGGAKPKAEKDPAAAKADPAAYVLPDRRTSALKRRPSSIGFRKHSLVGSQSLLRHRAAQAVSRGEVDNFKDCLGVVFDEQLCLMEKLGDTGENLRSLKLLLATDGLGDKSNFRLAVAVRRGDNAEVVFTPATSPRVVLMDVAFPEFSTRLDDNQWAYHYSTPTNYSGSDLLAFVDEVGGPGRFVPINGSRAVVSIDGDATKFIVRGDGEPMSGAGPWRSPVPDLWTGLEPEIRAASSCALVSDASFGDLIIEAAYSGVVAKVMTDGSIVEVRDNKLWSSSTADPATHHWVPLLPYFCPRS